MKSLRIIFLILALGLIASCSSNNNNYKPKVSDTAKILKKKTIKTIEEKFAFATFLLPLPLYSLNTISSYKNYKKLKQSYKAENLLITSTEKKPIQKVDCTNCGAKILPATFKNNNGLCAPCFNKQYNKKGVTA